MPAGVSPREQPLHILQARESKLGAADEPSRAPSAVNDQGTPSCIGGPFMEGRARENDFCCYWDLLVGADEHSSAPFTVHNQGTSPCLGGRIMERHGLANDSGCPWNHLVDGLCGRSGESKFHPSLVAKFKTENAKSTGQWRCYRL
jgi:hypothetical protein